MKIPIRLKSLVSSLKILIWLMVVVQQEWLHTTNPQTLVTKVIHHLRDHCDLILIKYFHSETKFSAYTYFDLPIYIYAPCVFYWITVILSFCHSMLFQLCFFPCVSRVTGLLSHSRVYSSYFPYYTTHINTQIDIFNLEKYDYQFRQISFLNWKIILWKKLVHMRLCYI